MTTAACTSFGGLMAQRFCLGVAEAAIAPGFSLITGMFYLRKEQPIRQAGWFIGNCVALILGGLVSYGVLLIPNPPIPHWKLLFVIEGAVTVAYGVFMFFVLPDSVSTAWFLKPEERLRALARTLKNKTGVMDNGKFQWPQLWEALRDPQTWMLVLYTFCINLPNGALTTVS
jgi:MFS family permease